MDVTRRRYACSILQQANSSQQPGSNLSTSKHRTMQQAPASNPAAMQQPVNERILSHATGASKQTASQAATCW
jgi:hypothetical protein